MSRVEEKQLRSILVLSAILIGVILMGITFTRNLDWRNEKTLVESELKLHPEDGRLYFDLGHISVQEKNFPEAEKYFNKALQSEISPIHKTMTYNELGHMYKVTNNLDQAKEYYLKSLEITPTYVNSLNSLGDISFKQQDYEAALHYFKRSVEIHPGSALYNSNLGTAHIVLGDKENALKCWKRSLSIDPDQPKLIRYISDNE